MGAAGLRNVRLTIENKTVVRTPAGDETETWTTLATVWAARSDLRGEEFYAANSLLTRVDALFRIVYIDGVSVLSRLKVGSDTFDVTRVVRVGAKRRELELYASSGMRDAR